MPNRIIPYNPALKELAKKLRKESTLSEVLLWKQLRNKSAGLEFHRQVPIDNYIVDFYCHEIRLAIEIDGGSHNDEQVSNNDQLRQQRLEDLGITFIRFNDKDVKKDMPNVLRALEGIIERLKDSDVA